MDKKGTIVIDIKGLFPYDKGVQLRGVNGGFEKRTYFQFGRVDDKVKVIDWYEAKELVERAKGQGQEVHILFCNDGVI